MADYDSSLPIRTETDGDAVVKVAGSTIANIWDIDANGIGQVNLNDGTNSLVISASGVSKIAMHIIYNQSLKSFICPSI